MSLTTLAGPDPCFTSTASTLIPARTLPFQQITARLLGRPGMYCCRLIVRRSGNLREPKASDPKIAPKNRRKIPRHLVGEVFRSEEHTSELQSQSNLVCRLL